jgi:hypothetical protein
VTSATPQELVTLIRRLTTVTERQLDAARSLDGPELDRQNQARTDVLFELQIRLESAQPLDDDTRAQLVKEIDPLTQLESRLTRVAGIVATALAPASARQRPATYGRSGAVRER